MRRHDDDVPATGGRAGGGEWRAPGAGDDRSPAVHAALERLSDAFDELAGLALSGLGEDDAEELLRSLTAASGRLEGVTARVVCEADRRRLGDRIGARDTGPWWARSTRLTRREAAGRVRLARRLSAEVHEPVARALAQGGLLPDQARVVVRAVDALPDDLDPAVRAAARDRLVELAADHDADQLRTLGRRILEVVAPDVADDQERRALEREEARARKRTWLTSRTLGDGSTLVRARVPDAVAGRLLTYLHAYTSPRRAHPGSHPVPSPLGRGDAGERVPHDVALGRAFCSLLEDLDPQRLPIHGGTATTLVVTVALTDLVAGVGAATTSSGDRISVGEARRLACTADLVPAVLGGDSELLDLGRSRRLFSRAQRRALVIRDRTCRAEDCDVPAAWTEAHHLDPWSRGGPTDLGNAALLCSHHHHRAHDPVFRHDRLPSGAVRFHRRT